MPRRALVTGGSGGIGLELAAADLESAHGVQVEPVTCDLSLPGAAREVFARIPNWLRSHRGLRRDGCCWRFPSAPCSARSERPRA